MYCSFCGTKNEDGASNCVNCGASLGAPVTPEAPAMPQMQMPQYQATPNQMPPNQMPQYQMPPQAQASTASKPMMEVMIIGMIASGIYALGALLPYARVAILGSISLIDGGILSDAGIVLLFGLLGIGASATPKRSVTILIMGLLQLGLVLLKTQAVSSGYFVYSAGYYCLWIGGFVTTITGIYGIIKHSKM